jgi:hypothetical protein
MWAGGVVCKCVGRRRQPIPMSPKVQFAYYALWIGHPVLQSALAILMYRRKLHRKFPVFFAYAISQVLIFAVVFLAHLKASYPTYFYAYWVTAAISLALGFQVIYEIFLDIFRPYYTLKDLGTVLFKWASVVMLLVAAVVAAASPSSDQGPLVQAVLTVQRCVRVIQCGLVLFLLLFARYLAVSWKRQSFGVAFGFGTFAAVELFIVALHEANHAGHIGAYLANMVAYNCAILIWIGYMRYGNATRVSSAPVLVPQRWDESLMDLQHPMPADSLIPMFEGMVERAFTHSGEGSSSNVSPAGDAAAKRKELANSVPTSGSAESSSKG